MGVGQEAVGTELGSHRAGGRHLVTPHRTFPSAPSCFLLHLLCHPAVRCGPSQRPFLPLRVPLVPGGRATGTVRPTGPTLWVPLASELVSSPWWVRGGRKEAGVCVHGGAAGGPWLSRGTPWKLPGQGLTPCPWGAGHWETLDPPAMSMGAALRGSGSAPPPRSPGLLCVTLGLRQGPAVP